MIQIDENEFTSDHTTKQCNNFMECVRSKIGNSKQPLFDGMQPDRVYYSTIVDIEDAEVKLLPYG